MELLDGIFSLASDLVFCEMKKSMASMGFFIFKIIIFYDRWTDGGMDGGTSLFDYLQFDVD